MLLVPSTMIFPALRAQQPDQRLQEHRLTGTRPAEENAALAGRDLHRDVFPNSRGPKDFVSPST